MGENDEQSRVHKEEKKKWTRQGMSKKHETQRHNGKNSERRARARKTKAISNKMKK